MLVPRCPLKEVNWLSPTSYSLMRECFLKGSWTATSAERLLPRHPDAIMGSLIHKMYELVSRGAIKSEEDFEGAWQNERHIEEEKLLRSKLESHLVPIDNHVRNLGEEKYLCWLNVKQMIDKRSTFNTGKSLESRYWRTSVEESIEADEYHVRGRADIVKWGSSGVEIVDIKSGVIFQDVGNERKLKRGIQDQLKIYAGLFFIKHGVWPSRLAVSSSSGELFDVAFSINECIDLLKKADCMRHSVNSVIKSLKLHELEKGWLLARPEPATCRYCPYRPACGPYWNKRTQFPSLAWPVDVKGKIESISTTATGRVAVALIRETSDPSTVVITAPRGVIDRENYVGGCIAAYSLKNISKDRLAWQSTSAIYRC